MGVSTTRGCPWGTGGPWGGPAACTHRSWSSIRQVPPSCPGLVYNYTSLQHKGGCAAGGVLPGLTDPAAAADSMVGLVTVPL
jgi:hypothetical protein